MRNELIILLEKHCGTVRAEAAEIDICFDAFTPEPDEETLKRTIFLVHKIKGSSGALGFPDLSGAAHALEYALRNLHLQENLAGPLSDIHALSDTLQNRVLEMTPETSSLHKSSVMAQM